MKCFMAILCGWLMTSAVVAALGENLRFSQQLTAAERTDAALQTVTPDQLAVLDALIRRDQKWCTEPGSAPPSPARFSQRISSDERKTAGLESIDETHLFRLDVLVAHFEFGATPVAVSALPIGILTQPKLERPGIEIHGMISFTVGGGNGYSQVGGSMVLVFDDPSHDFSMLIGYGQTHTEGPLLGYGRYAHPYYYRPSEGFLQAAH